MELFRRSDDEYLLLVRDILDARDLDDLVELEARAVRRGSPPGRKSSGGRGNQAITHKRVSPSQRQTRNRVTPRSRPQPPPSRAGNARQRLQGNLGAVRARNPPQAAPPSNGVTAGAHPITMKPSRYPIQWHLPTRRSSTDQGALPGPIAVRP